MGSTKSTSIGNQSQILAVRALEVILEEAGTGGLTSMHWTTDTHRPSLSGHLSDLDTPRPRLAFEAWRSS